jgi:pilus assembly protein CpaC
MAVVASAMTTLNAASAQQALQGPGFVPSAPGVVANEPAAVPYTDGIPVNPLVYQHPQQGQMIVAPPSEAVPQLVSGDVYQANVAPVQYTTEPRRTADSRIAAMPTADDELEVIHHRSQLVVTTQPISRIAITDPNIIDVAQYSPTEISIIGLGLGTTDMTIWFGEGQAPLMALVTVVRDPSLDEQRRIDYGRIERYIAQLYPNSKVYLIPMSQKIIVRGQAKDPQEAANILQVVRGEIIAQDPTLSDFAQGYGGGYGAYGNDRNTIADANGAFNDLFSTLIVNELQVPGEYTVMVRVRIAELNREQLRRYGLDWNVIFNDARHVIGQSFAAAAPVLTGVFENGEVSVLLEALAANGSMKIMEDSVIVTLSGRPAAFLSGGEFAVPTVVGINGVGAGTTTFRGFGSSVITTPTVVDDDLIRMQIIAELSAIDADNAVNGIPGTNVNRVQTQVELREGQTIVLGGLFSRQQGAEVTRIPLLGELPIVGTSLFSSKRATEDEKEMLILLTPEFGRAMDPEEVPPLPGWYVTHPDDFDFCKFNRIEGNPDLGDYRLLPFGNGQGYAENRGYNIHNPAPADGQYMPQGTGAAQWGQTVQPPIGNYNSPFPPSSPYGDAYASPVMPQESMPFPGNPQQPIYSTPQYQPAPQYQNGPQYPNPAPAPMTSPEAGGQGAPATTYYGHGTPVRSASYGVQR